MKNSILIFLFSFVFSITTHAEQLFGPDKKLIEEQAKRIAENKAKQEILNKKFRLAKAEELKGAQAATKDYLEKLKEMPIKGIEILTAGSDDSSIVSAFGHSSLRLVMGGDPFEDIVISPQAFIDDMEIDMGKGMVGGYTIIPQMWSFLDFLIQYHKGESRSITRTIIPTTPEERLKIIDAFLELNNNPKSYGKKGYKFLTNNCATVVMKALAEAGVVPHEVVGNDDISFAAAVLSWVPVLAPYVGPLAVSSDTPSAIVHGLRGVLLTTTVPNSAIPAIDVFFKEMKEQGSYFLSHESSKWKQKDIDNLSKISVQALYMLYVGPIELSEELRAHVMSLLKTRGFDLNRVYNMQEFPQSLYSVCDDTRCAIQNYKIIRSIWNKKELMSSTGDWGMAPIKKYDLKKYKKFTGFGPFNIRQEYSIYMQNLFAWDLRR